MLVVYEIELVTHVTLNRRQQSKQRTFSVISVASCFLLILLNSLLTLTLDMRNTGQARKFNCLFSFLFLLVLGHSSHAKSADQLLTNFQNPPTSAWPRTWWHWTRGMVTRDGITKDLEWMQRVGIGGFQLANVEFGSGQEIDPRVEYGNKQWLELVKHSAAEAKRLGLEMAIFSSPGWSLTGGPWVEPRQAMKKLVWSRTSVKGPGQQTIEVPAPPSSIGQFQDIGSDRRRSASETFYADAKVLAVPLPDEIEESPGGFQLTSNMGPIEDEKLCDESYVGVTTIDAADDGKAWIQYQYEKPCTVRAVTVSGPGGIPVGRILASDDGREFRTLVTLPGSQLYRQGRFRTFAVSATTARFFRLEMTAAPLRPDRTMSEEPPLPAERYALFEFALHTQPRVHRWEEKAGFCLLFEYDSVATPAVPDELVIPSSGVLDLTDKMQDDGTLDWDVPAGRWQILRLGYSLTGAKNRPAPPAGSGYEVDKLSRQHTEHYYDAYAGPLKRALGDLYGNSLTHWLMDSWEAGWQNWTDNMVDEFRQRRGYDPTPYLPTLTGVVVDSADVSDRFLWDFRRTLVEMLAENHYGAIAERLHADGLKLYSEATGVSLETLEDSLLTKSLVDIPMGEFWVRDLHPRLMYLQDVRSAASAAHVYGKPIVGAESFTGGGYESPLKLKTVSDYWLAQGINRLIFHTSAHQPLDTKPGNTMVGTHLHRNITWAEQAKPLMEYFSRVCYLLQQGEPVVDIAYLLDEGAPSTPPIWGSGTLPTPPAGYDHDFVNVDALLKRLETNEAGRLALPGGSSYALLVLPSTQRLRPEVIEKLHQLVSEGATIIGPKLVSSPSLAGFAQADERVRQLAEQLWGDLNGTTRTIHKLGNGNVIWGRPLPEVLQRIALPPDVELSAPLDAQFAWRHRATATADVYFLSNLQDREVSFEARFRLAGRKPALWLPDSGESFALEHSSSELTTKVPLTLSANQTVFVVFSDEPLPKQLQPAKLVELQELNEPWHIEFPADLGAPASIELPELLAWSAHPEAGVRYFSGTAKYTTQFESAEDVLREGAQLVLDLGEVFDLAQVRLNDQPLGIVWKPPYQVDVTSALRPGQNELVVQVTNQWTNRLIGDAKLPEAQRIFPVERTPRRFGRLPDEPLPAGLLGPVRLLQER